nr:hypothetical protein [Microbacterium sp. Se5.02b]
MRLTVGGEVSAAAARSAPDISTTSSGRSAQMRATRCALGMSEGSTERM